MLSHPRNRSVQGTNVYSPVSISEKEIYKRSDVLVVGVSSDPVEKQKAFVERHKLTVSCS